MYYHLSPQSDLSTLQPSIFIPHWSYYEDEEEYRKYVNEVESPPHVCASPSIELCIVALRLHKGDVRYVYEINQEPDDIGQAFDQSVTREVYYYSEVEVNCIGKIQVISTEYWKEGFEIKYSVRYEWIKEK